MRKEQLCKFTFLNLPCLFLPPKQGTEPPPPKKRSLSTKRAPSLRCQMVMGSKGSSKSLARSTASMKLGNMICFLAVELSDLDGKIPI